MSVYDDINYKSGYEKKNNTLPTDEVIEGYEKDFISTWKNVKTSEIKSNLHLNPNEGVKFDFMNNNQEFIHEEYFKNLTTIEEYSSNEEKLEYLLDFLTFSFGVLTPSSLKKFNEDFLGMNKEELGFYQDMIYTTFGKYQINLKDNQERSSFKKLLTGHIHK